MILYQYPGGDGLSSISPPCMKVEMALRLLGVEYKVRNLYGTNSARRVSVTGRLPVLEIDGERVPDSNIILDRLERHRPDADLWPTDPVQRVQDRLWDHFATDAMYWLGFYLRWVDPRTSGPSFRALFGRMSWPKRFAIRAFFLPRQRRRALLHGVGGKSPESVRAEMKRAFGMVDDGLAGGPFLQGRDHPGRGDLACAALIAQAGFRASLPETMDEVLARPALPAHTTRVFDACGMRAPAWLA
jgi:glutathione S-transferase